MQLCAILPSLVIYSVQILCATTTNVKLDSEEKLALLGYIHGYKIDQGSASKYPGVLVSPVIVIPELNRKKADTQVNSIKQVANNTSIVGKVLLDEDNDIEVNFRQALDRGSENKTDSTNEDLKRSTGVTTINTISITTQANATTVKTVTVKTTTELPKSTKISPGGYPNAVYNNQDINSLAITVKSPDDILYPPVANEQWQNFTDNTNISLKENTTDEEHSDSINIARYPANKTDSTIKGVYSAALYNNAKIDQLSITTNSYTNRSPLPPPQDDGWSKFASLRKNLLPSNEFRPLAGLYYDGFLHKPIIQTQGFVPYRHYPLPSLL